MGTTDRKLEEVLAWFSKAIGPTMAALYCSVGPEWVAKVMEPVEGAPLSTNEETDT